MDWRTAWKNSSRLTQYLYPDQLHLVQLQLRDLFLPTPHAFLSSRKC
jgi:hypothetical protein